MGLTRADAERCGIGHLYPAEGGEAMARTKAPGRPRITGKNGLGQNKTEAAFDRHLADLRAAGRIRDYRWEPFKLRLAAKTYLDVDFVVLPAPATAVLNVCPLVLIDVKGGPVEDDAAVKMKVAADRFAWLGTFWVVRKAGASWESTPVTPQGGFGRPLPGDQWL